MNACRPFAKRAAVLLALAVPLTLTACWLPPREVIKEKAAARDAWRAQQKENKLAEAQGRAPRAIITDEQVAVLANEKRQETTPTHASAPNVSGMHDTQGQSPMPSEGRTRNAAIKDEPIILTSADGTTAQIVRPASLKSAQAPWMKLVDPDTVNRLDGWRSALEKDSAATIARGDGIPLAKTGRLLEPDAAMLYGALPPGLYDCRLHQLNGPIAAYVSGELRRCRVWVDGGDRRLSVITTANTPVGIIHDNDAFSAVYLGNGLAQAMAGGGAMLEPLSAEAGLVQRVADTRWRLIIPGAIDGPTLVLELTRPRPVE